MLHPAACGEEEELEADGDDEAQPGYGGCIQASQEQEVSQQEGGAKITVDDDPLPCQAWRTGEHVETEEQAEDGEGGEWGCNNHRGVHLLWVHFYWSITRSLPKFVSP